MNQLSVGDPFLGLTATSTPFGASDHSLLQFQDHMRFLRERIRCLLIRIESQKSDCARHAPALMAELQALYAGFIGARTTRFGWQDIHSVDYDLARRVRRFLAKP